MFKGKKETVYNYAIEILISKSELEKKNSLIEELKQKVDESKTECTYQLRQQIVFFRLLTAFLFSLSKSF